MKDLAQYASELAIVFAPKVHNSFTTRRKFKPRVLSVVQSSSSLAPDPMVEVTNDSTLGSNRQESES